MPWHLEPVQHSYNHLSNITYFLHSMCAYTLKISSDPEKTYIWILKIDSISCVQICSIFIRRWDYHDKGSWRLRRLHPRTCAKKIKLSEKSYQTHRNVVAAMRKITFHRSFNFPMDITRIIAVFLDSLHVGAFQMP